MKNYCNTLIIFMLTIACLHTSCKKPEITNDPDLLKFLYANSVDTVEIRSTRYFLESYLYRNFMPGAFKERGLFAVVYLVRADSLPVPSDIALTKLYIIQNQSIWISVPGNSTDPFIPDFKQSKVSTEGPEWDTEINVDVIAEVSDNSSKDKYLIIARQQNIERPE